MKPVLFFLAGYWLYIDAVDTIIRMAVDYGVKLGFAPGALIKALLLVQFIGFPAAVAYGWLADRVGTRRMIYVGLLIYGAVTGGSYRSAERRVGKECVSTCSSRGTQDHSQTKQQTKQTCNDILHRTN